MLVIFILAGILISAAGVILWLGHAIKKEEARLVEINAVPIINTDEIKTVVVSNAKINEESSSAVPAYVVAALEELDRASELAGPGQIVIESDTRLAGVGNMVEPRATSVAEKDEVLELKDELRRMRERAVMQARESIDIIKDLRDKNQALRDQLNGLKQSFVLPQESLRYDLEKINADLSSEYQAQFDLLVKEIASLKNDNAALQASQAVQVEKVVAHSFLNTEAVEALQEDIAVLGQGRSKLERRIEELEMAVRDEQEKNSILQYELTKSRAQAVGIERICDNARRKFEGVTQEEQVIEQDNVFLKRQSTVLVNRGRSPIS